MVLIALGAFNVSVEYLFKPKGRRTWHYRRHVPTSVKAHYDQPHILKSLQTDMMSQPLNWQQSLTDAMKKNLVV